MAATNQTQEDDVKSKPRNVDEFLKLARKRFQIAMDAEAAVRKDALEDLKFSVGQGQWPADIETRRQEEGKPAITVNRLDQHIKLVGNEQRQQRPSIHINPVGDGADKDTAEILQGIIRHIEVQSDAEVAYDEAHDGMLRKGFDYFRVTTEYIDPVSETNFDQEIRIKWIKDAFRVYVDPTCNEHDYSDAKYMFIEEVMSIEEYKNQYPKSELAALEDFQSAGDVDPDWAGEHGIRVAEYLYVEQDYIDVKNEAGRTKKVARRQVKWAKINAIEILEETDWAGRWIGIVPVLGTDKIVDGKRYLAGLVRNAKGAQRSYNYGISTAWETAGLTPKAPFIADHRTVSDFEQMWEQANRRNLAVLYYNSMPEGHQGEPLPAPQRSSVEPPLQAFALLIKQADYDLKASLGMFDPSLGQNKSDQSGKAIQSLQKQGDLATLNYSDNLARSIRHLGRILIDLIPHIYDAPRVQRIINPDSSVDHVGIFNSQKSGMSMDEVRNLPEMEKIKKIYDIGVGRYDVTVSVGPSYQTKRQEAVATQMELMSSVPIVQNAAPDLIIRNMDIPGSDAIADRVKKLLPPALQDSDDDNDPNVLKAKLGALSQQHQVAMQALQEAQTVIQTKQVEANGKKEIAAMQIASDERIKAAEGKLKLTIAEVETKSQEMQTRMAMEKEVWAELHGAAHEVGMMHITQAHEKDLADRAQSLAEAQPAEPTESADNGNGS